MSEVRIYSYIKDGRISQTAKQELAKFIRANDGKELIFEVYEKSTERKRSNSWNRYFHGPFIKQIYEQMLDIHPLTRGQIKTITKRAVMPMIGYPPNKIEFEGDIYYDDYSTAKLTEEEFEEFIQLAIRMWAEKGVFILNRNEEPMMVDQS